MNVRPLVPEDHIRLHAFLTRHRDYCMFMLSNLTISGITAGDEPYQGQYWGAFDETGSLVGAAAVFWNGILMPAAPEGLEELAGAVRRQTNRLITGFIGELSQVERLADWFGVDRYKFDSPEALFSLPLDNLSRPALLDRPDIEWRLAQPEDASFLVDWRAQYLHESMDEPLTQANRETARKQMHTNIENRDCYLLVHDNQPVAMTGFNARVETCVQVGGVYTPPELRSRGYGRAAVAGSLLQARAQGMRHSILFTGFTNQAAQRAYEAIGYQRIGEYGLKILVEGIR